MTPAPREAEGGPGSRHGGKDRWPFAAGGAGVAVIGGRRVELRSGMPVLNRPGEAHGYRTTGTEPLRALNLYAPPRIRRRRGRNARRQAVTRPAAGG